MPRKASTHHHRRRRRCLAAAATVATLVFPSIIVPQEALANSSYSIAQGSEVQAVSKYGPTGIEFVLDTDAVLADGTTLPAGTTLKRCTDQASIDDCRYIFDFEPGTVVNVVYTYLTHESTVRTTVVGRTPLDQGEDVPLAPEEFEAGEYSISYPGSYARVGSPGVSGIPTATRTIDGVRYPNQPLPEGTTFQVSTSGSAKASVDASGRVTLIAPEQAQPGEKVEVQVTATYPDESTSTVTAAFILTEKLQKEIFAPAYESGREVVPGGTVTLRQTATDVPDDVQFYGLTSSKDRHGWAAAVDPATGNLTVTAPKEGATPLTYRTAAAYSDGSYSIFTAEIGVKEAAAAAAGAHTVAFPAVTATASGSVTPAFTGTVPDGAEFELVDAGSLLGASVNKQTGELRFTGATKVAEGTGNAPTTGGTESGALAPVVKVTYPDGSEKLLTVPVEAPAADAGADSRQSSGKEPVEDRACRVEGSTTSSVRECAAGVIVLLAGAIGLIGLVVGAARLFKDYLPAQVRPYLPEAW